MGRTRGAGAKRTALVGVLSALSLALLYAANLAPGGRMGVVAAAGLVPAAAVVSAGLPAGLFCYAATGLLGLLLVPDKGTAALYLIFFGLYPVVKSLIERIKSLPAEYLCKLAFFNAVLSLLWFGLRGIFLPFLPAALTGAAWLVYAAGNLAFLAYDFGFSKLIAFYAGRIDSALRRG